jgi:4a-hydroxytetrahydrobiopterin dehydratase
MKVLTKKQLSASLKVLPKWKTAQSETKLYRTFAFTNYVNALAFVAKVAVHAEVMGHHPDLHISHDKVKVILTTDETKGLTSKDIELALRIERVSTK